MAAIAVFEENLHHIITSRCEPTSLPNALSRKRCHRLSVMLCHRRAPRRQNGDDVWDSAVVHFVSESISRLVVSVAVVVCGARSLAPVAVGNRAVGGCVVASLSERDTSETRQPFSLPYLPRRLLSRGLHPLPPLFPFLPPFTPPACLTL